MKQLIDAGMWKISTQCEKLIECLPTLVRDMERNPEDVLKVDHSDTYIGDDPYDAARYGIASQISAVRKPLEERVADKIAQITAAEPNATITDLARAHANIIAAEKRGMVRPVRMKRRFGSSRFVVN